MSANLRPIAVACILAGTTACPAVSWGAVSYDIEVRGPHHFDAMLSDSGTDTFCVRSMIRDGRYGTILVASADKVTAFITGIEFSDLQVAKSTKAILRVGNSRKTVSTIAASTSGMVAIDLDASDAEYLRRNRYGRLEVRIGGNIASVDFLPRSLSDGYRRIARCMKRLKVEVSSRNEPERFIAARLAWLALADRDWNALLHLAATLTEGLHFRKDPEQATKLIESFFLQGRVSMDMA